MTHPEKGNSEETSEKDETKEILLEEKPEEFLVTPEEKVVEEEVLPEKEEKEEEPPEEWTCDICGEAKESPPDPPLKIYGYYEEICAQCHDRGLMWSIKEAWKWRSQIRIDVLRKPKDE